MIEVAILLMVRRRFEKEWNEHLAKVRREIVLDDKSLLQQSYSFRVFSSEYEGTISIVVQIKPKDIGHGDDFLQRVFKGSLVLSNGVGPIVKCPVAPERNQMWSSEAKARVPSVLYTFSFDRAFLARSTFTLNVSDPTASTNEPSSTSYHFPFSALLPPAND